MTSKERGRGSEQVEELARALAALPGWSGIALERDERPVRLLCETAHPPYTRYLQFTPTAPGAQVAFGLLWGQYSQGKAPDDFDARSMGDLDYCVACARAWLLEGCVSQQFPPPARPGS